MINQNAVIRAHVAAVSSMLLGNRRLRPSAVLLGGDRLDPLARLNIGRSACDAQTDIVHLGFDEQADGAALTDISIFVPRDRICWSHLGCQLWLSKTGRARCCCRSRMSAAASGSRPARSSTWTSSP